MWNNSTKNNTIDYEKLFILNELWKKNSNKNNWNKIKTLYNDINKKNNIKRAKANKLRNNLKLFEKINYDESKMNQDIPQDVKENIKIKTRISVIVNGLDIINEKLEIKLDYQNIINNMKDNWMKDIVI